MSQLPMAEAIPRFKANEERVDDFVNGAGYTTSGGVFVPGLGRYNNRGAWTASTAYTVFDLVLQAGNYYLCKVAHTSGVSFDASKWVVYQGITTLELSQTTGAAAVGANDGAGGANYDNVQEYIDYLETAAGASAVGVATGLRLDALLKNSTPYVVDNVAAIRNIDSTKHLRATASNYYSGVSGGGDDFDADPSDVTGVDDGGVLIVATDGMRWKRRPRGIISALAFGCVGDDNFDNNVRGQAYVTWALNNFAPMYFPSGKYRSSAAWTGTGKPAHVFGDSVDSTQIIFTNAASGGFLFTMNPQSGSVPPQQCTVRQITIETRAAITTPGFGATWTSRVPNAFGQFWAEDVNIVRNNAGTSSFSEGVRLRNCCGGWLDNVNILGDDARVGNYGLRLESCIEIMTENMRINRYKEGVHINKLLGGDPQTEGIFINNSFLFDCNRGIYSPDAAIHINVKGTFINPNGPAANSCVEFVDCSQGLIEGGLFYIGGNPGDPGNQDAIRFNGGNGNRVSGTKIVGITKANARYGVITSGGSSYNTIEDVDFSSFSGAGVNISAVGDTGNRVADNDFYDCTANILNAGTGTLRKDNTATPAGGSPVPIDSLRWGAAAGGFGVGEISSDANWGAYIRGRSGGFADLALVNSANTPMIQLVTTNVVMNLPTSSSGLPSGALWRDPAASHVIKMVP